MAIIILKFVILGCTTADPYRKLDAGSALPVSNLVTLARRGRPLDLNDQALLAAVEDESLTRILAENFNNSVLQFMFFGDHWLGGQSRVIAPPLTSIGLDQLRKSWSARPNHWSLAWGQERQLWRQPIHLSLFFFRYASSKPCHFTSRFLKVEV
uniref:Uncharacterized protein n=1 Tax=Glossina austeni TaxID=7395 RepID=A0A1A9UD38_GLOAU